MEIKKVLTLSEEDEATLVAAGQLLGNINKMFESKEIDQISADTAQLIEALQTVIEKIVK